MSKETTKTRITAAQTAVLCTFFEENPEVIRGYKKTPKCVDAVQSKWKKITPQLNSLGPYRDHKAWAKYLCDMKAKLKRKRIKWKQNSNGTGPIICNADDFNEIKLRMLQVLRKDAVKSLDNYVSITSDLEMEDHQKLEQDDVNDEGPKLEENEDDNYGMMLFPPKESENDMKSDHACIRLIPGERMEAEGSQIFNNHEQNDEFDTFGKNVAQQLRTMPLAVALITQEMLLSILRKQRLKCLNNSTKDPFS